MTAAAANIDSYVDRATDFLTLAAGGSDVLFNAVAGLRLALVAAEAFDTAQASAGKASRLTNALRTAAPIVAEHTGPALAAERVFTGMAAAGGLAALFGLPPDTVKARDTLPKVLDKIDYAAQLANDLDTLRRRREIAARGDAFSRHIAIQNALRTDAAGATLQ